MEQFKGIIYQAINIQNKKSYIGKTVQEFEYYINEHIDNALKGYDLKDNPKGKYFYNAIRKYGAHNFKWVVLGEIESNDLYNFNEKLNEAEIESILLFRTFGSNGENIDAIYGYNCTKGGEGCSGYKHSEESNLKNSIRNTGKKQSQETIDKRVSKNTGKKRPESAKIKNSTDRKGMVFPEEWRNNMSKAKTGVKQSQETIDNRVEKTKGKNHHNYVEVDIDLIFKLKDEGLSPQKIANRLGTTRRIVDKRLKYPERFI